MPKITPSRAADPHRATRRNHYQEGPGFLFLATQNGRPSGADNRPNLDGVRKRMRAVRHAQEVGIEAAAGEIGVRQRSLYRWSAIFEAKGIEGLLDGCRRPHRLRTTTPAWVDMVVIAIRLHTYWNSKRIAAEMRRRQIFRVSPGHIDHQEASIKVVAELQEAPPKMIRIAYFLQLVTDEPQHRVDLLHRIRQHGTIYNTLAATCDVSGVVVVQRLHEIVAH
jgi:transposase